MASWSEIITLMPDFAARIQAVLDKHKHKTMATLRKDGSPRISGTEANFRDGELWLGMMPGSLKSRDVMRDPRLALHSATADVKLTSGDAKVAGRAVRVTDPIAVRAAIPPEMEPENAVIFRVDIDEVVLTRVGDPPDHLVIEIWTSERGFRSVRRR